MKVLILAGLFSAAAVPIAAASDYGVDCQVDDTRRGAQARVDTDLPGGSAPLLAATPVAPVTREAAATPTTRAPVQPRRRSGKRIPDAELIGPRGAL